VKRRQVSAGASNIWSNVLAPILRRWALSIEKVISIGLDRVNTAAGNATNIPQVQLAKNKAQNPSKPTIQLIWDTAPCHKYAQVQT
jgi:hypothetical protein